MTLANNIIDRGEVALVMELVLLRMTKLILNLRMRPIWSKFIYYSQIILLIKNIIAS